MLRKLLIANRGEIAVRINRTAQALGYRTVAVYSEADAGALHVTEADEAVCLGPAQANASYLNSEAVLEAARITGADSIHPGYGFLSENAEFARACRAAGLVFVGPPEAAIELMASKRRAKEAMVAAGVPVVPGYESARASDAALTDAADALGYPLMIKASAGGGGRGMRLVRQASELAEALTRARSEARQAFGDDELILERAVVDARHVEIQVFADRHGHVVHLGDRDCSIQRRHQKVVEEAPSPFVTPALRQAMGEAAVRAARACGYEGAGTVEFLVGQDRTFYFLEMNTRLQVEHPVTEQITGQDLVAWQLAVAEGRPLPLTQAEIPLHGHAIEARLYAEDPARAFQPQTGTLLRFDAATGEGVRVDTGVRAGDRISPHYDPMLAKIVAWGSDRDQARRRLIRALEDTVVFGVTTNRHFLSRVIDHDLFGQGNATTAFLEQTFATSPCLSPQPPALAELAIAAAILGTDGGAGWSNAGTGVIPLTLASGDTVHHLRLCRHDQALTVTEGDRSHTLTLMSRSRGQVDFIAQGVRQVCQYQLQGDCLYWQASGQTWSVRDLTHQPATTDAPDHGGEVRASMDGAIVEVRVSEGDTVSPGQTLAVLEAMKMEHPLRATGAGVIARIHIQPGDQVGRGQRLIEIRQPEADTTSP